MTEDTHVTLQRLVGMLEGLQNCPDDADFSKKAHNNLLISLNTLLGRVDAVASTDADKTKEDVDFLPSALAILEFLRTKCIEDQANHLRILSFQVLMAHPQATLIKLVANHSPILIETFGLYLALGPSELEVKMEALILLQLLEWLPEQEKEVFINEGIPLWLSKVLPTLIEILTMIDDNEKIQIYIHYVELLTNELVLFDYFNYPEWNFFLNDVADPRKFPASIKSLLDKDNHNWHRLWIIIVKLLKSLLTCNSLFGTPISTMLPVVETAFKKESPHRVRAFKCWNELILNFGNELDSIWLAKRMRLIVTPLKLNITRTEETVVAKFETLWLLIRTFKLKIEQFANEILIPFLLFVFGKDLANVKPSLWAGQLSQGARIQALEALVEIVGHNDCVTKCTQNISPLNGKIITTGLLIDHWRYWIHALRGAIKLAAMNYTEHTKKNIMCIWKSYLLLMAELVDNSVRKDLFNELVNCLGALIQDFKLYVDLPEILITDLIKTLFSDNRFKTLLSSKGQHQPMLKIATIVADKTLDPFYNRFKPQDLMSALNPLVTALISDSTRTPACLIMILDHLPTTGGALKLWTALVKTATVSDLCQQVLNSILRWPLRVVHSYTEVKEAASAWYALYNVMHVKFDMAEFDNEISKVLTKPVDDSKAVNYFFMFALIGVLKHNPDEDKMAKLEALTDEMIDYEELEQIMPPLIDTLVLMLDYVAKKEDENLAEIVINCVKNALKVKKIKGENEASLCDGEVNIHNMISNTIIAALRTYLAKCTNESIKSEIINVITSHDKQVVESPKNIKVVSIKFASPKVENVKKSKKEEARIVNTVVENGEEYVVVTSNWKFNPKNLTENQKEKFQRRREIPALYQDLSQSQDEIRLTSWKTDSQDTSLSSSKSNSKSASNTNAAEVLLNMPSADVVPTILDSILMDGKNKPPKTVGNKSPVSKDKPQKVDKTTPTTVTKSPRMALKDRITRNYRNLIEKSSPSPQKETTVVKEVKNQIENVSASPVHKPKNDDQVNLTEKQTLPEQQMKPEDSLLNNKQDNPTPNVCNSCLVPDKQENLTPNISQSPEVNSKRSIILTAKQSNQNKTIVPKPVRNLRKASTERPARMKRKPKKYDDSLLLDLKMMRNLNDSLGSQNVQDSEPVITVAQVHSSKNGNVDTVQQKIAEAEAIHIQKNDKSNTIIEIYDIRLSDDDCIDLQKTIKTIPVTTTTPSTENPTKNLSEKPTNISEIPTNHISRKASEGIENDGGQIVIKEMIDQLPIVTTPLKTKTKEVKHQTSTIQKVSAQNDENSDTINMPPSKCKRSKVQNENVINDDKTSSVSSISVVKSSMKKTKKKSRIENELMIDMVEGHPFLQAHSEKRLTRKQIIETEISGRRKSLAEKLSKSKLEATPKSTNKSKDKKTSSIINTITVKDSQDRRSSSPEDAVMEEPCSEDIIESSQDSTITTVSVKSIKRPPMLPAFLQLLLERLTYKLELYKDKILNKMVK